MDKHGEATNLGPRVACWVNLHLARVFPNVEFAAGDSVAFGARGPHTCANFKIANECDPLASRCE